MNKISENRYVMFRADSFPQIGTGDIFSCIYLGNYFLTKGIIPLYVFRKSPSAEKIVNIKALEHVFWLPEDCSEEDDVRMTYELVSKWNVLHLIWQITAYDFSAYNLSSVVPQSCINFDGDIPAFTFKSVINWCVGVEELYLNHQDESTRFLLGPDFVVLSDEYDNEFVLREKKRFPQKVLVCFGGSDHGSFSFKVLELLNALEVAGLKITVVAGPGNLDYTKLCEVAKSNPSIDVLEPQKSLKSLFLEHDFVISAAGLAASELVATKTPCALIPVVPHQEKRCEYFSKMNWCLSFIDKNILDGDYLWEHICSFYDKYEAPNVVFEGKNSIYRAIFPDGLS